MLDTFEGRNQFEADKAFLVPLDMLEQELVLGDVGIAEVEFNLLDNLLTKIIIGFFHRWHFLFSLQELATYFEIIAKEGPYPKFATRYYHF
jgi:hypothetical protein